MGDADVRGEADHSHRLTPSDLGIGRLFDAVQDGIVVSDLDGMIVLWNPAAERILGYSEDEVVGRRVDLIVPERLRSRHRAGMERYQTTGRGAFIESKLPLELPALHKDGREVPVELTLSRLEEAGWHVVVAIIRDITDRERLRKALEEERNALRTANESLEAFTYVVSHDLKEPVRGMRALLDELSVDLAGTTHAEEVRRAREASERMERMLRGLLEWSRAAAAPLEARPLDVAHVLAHADCAVYFDHLAQERGARVEIAPNLPRVVATEALLCQVLGNLVINGIRHNPSANPWVRVRRGAVGDEWAEIVVEDNGPGFPSTVIDRVMRLRNRPSTVRGGFGLAIVRRAVDRLGGRLVIENRPEGGGVARLRLVSAD